MSQADLDWRDSRPNELERLKREYRLADEYRRAVFGAETPSIAVMSQAQLRWDAAAHALAQKIVEG